jgi:hypothetical protein
MKNERLIGVLAAQAYLLARKPSRGRAREVARLVRAKSRTVCLYGIPLPQQHSVLKNALGQALPQLSL